MTKFDKYKNLDGIDLENKGKILVDEAPVEVDITNKPQKPSSNADKFKFLSIGIIAILLVLTIVFAIGTFQGQYKSNIQTTANCPDIPQCPPCPECHCPPCNFPNLSISNICQPTLNISTGTNNYFNFPSENQTNSST